MYFYSILNYGLCQKLDNKCGSDVNTYPIKQKAVDLNSALDKYCRLAFKYDRRWNFDDINESSPPIDAQNIVSGTNRYKFGSFTEKIINLIKLEILDSAGNGHNLIPETLDDLGMQLPGNVSGRLSDYSSRNFQDLYVDAASGLPTHYIKYGDFIYLRPNPNYSETDGLLAYFNRPASKFEFASFTNTEANPGVFTATAHGLTTNDTVILDTDGALSDNLVVDTVYYVIAGGFTADTFELATTLGGTAIDTSGGGQSGNHSFIKANKTPGIPETHHPFLYLHAAIEFLGDKTKLSQSDVMFLKELEQEIKDYFTKRDEDIIPRLCPELEDNR